MHVTRRHEDTKKTNQHASIGFDARREAPPHTATRGRARIAGPAQGDSCTAASDRVRGLLRRPRVEADRRSVRAASCRVMLSSGLLRAFVAS